MIRRPLSAALILVAVLTACATQGDPVSTPSPSQGSRPPFQTTSPGPIQPSGEPASIPADKLAAIKRDLDRRGVDTHDLVVESAERVTWNNGALGCPKAGQSYTQGQVPGMKIVVTSNGVRYDYRFGRSDTPSLCEG